MIVKGFVYLSVDPATVGRNTFCMDAKGNSVWEDDIVLPVSPDVHQTYKIITYYPKYGQWGMRSIISEAEKAWYPLKQGEFVVHGNIHTTPELIGKIPK